MGIKLSEGQKSSLLREAVHFAVMQVIRHKTWGSQFCCQHHEQIEVNLL